MVQLKMIALSALIVCISCSEGASTTRQDKKIPEKSPQKNDTIIGWNIKITPTANTKQYRTYWSDNSLQAEGPVIANKKNGLWKVYFKGSDGKRIMAEVYYKNDILDGEIKEYYTSGKLMSKIHYKNGILNGSRAIFYESGYGQLEEYYRNGKKNGKSFEYYDNGNIKENAYFQNDLRNGMSTVFYYNGKRQSSGRYIRGKKNGLWEYYNEQGMLESRGNYKNDKKTGIWTFYDKNGVKIETKKIDD